MSDIIFYIAAFIFVIALIIFGAWIWRNMMDSDGSNGGLFNRPEKRIGYIESVSIDAKRKLVLIRRDNMEHLIMTGGPVDVVIETGIIPHHVQPTTASGINRDFDDRLFEARGSKEQSEPGLNE